VIPASSATHSGNNAMHDFFSILRIVPRRDSRHSLIWRYGGAVLVSLAFLAVRWLVGRFIIDDGVPFATLFIPIALSAYYGGLGPGIVSVLTTVVLTDYFLIPPLYTLGLPNTNAVVGTLMFAISGLVISALGEASRKAVLQASGEAEIRRAAQQLLLANEERLHIAEQVVSGGVWDWDVANDSVYWSDGFQRLFDFPLEEKPSRQKWVDSLHPSDRDRVVRQLEDLFAHKLHNWATEYRVRTATGRVRWIASHGQVFYDQMGKPQRMVGINLDITARRLAEDPVRDAEPSTRAG
jgi:PAS domain S-box-containing protein